MVPDLKWFDFSNLPRCESNSVEIVLPVPIQPFCFSLSVQFSINYKRYVTLYFKIGFVLDDFCPTVGYASCLSTFKVGYATL